MVVTVLKLIAEKEECTHEILCGMKIFYAGRKKKGKEEKEGKEEGRERKEGKGKKEKRRKEKE